MCIDLKYGIWNVAGTDQGQVSALERAGYGPLTARVLCARGIATPAQAEHYLDRQAPLPDPFLMTDMAIAAARLAVAVEAGQKIAVFGDYDVDGVTSTCLLTDFLRKRGGDVVSYIPGRLEEGYGLNPMAIHGLHDQGVELIVTVDCGITAVSEAQLCRELGMELIITDHHECKAQLPGALAVVDPHRPGDHYPHKNLSGVGVAFKLACAISGEPEAVLEEYADMLCVGTVADVMPLTGETRRFVAQGLKALQHTKRPGLQALMKEADCNPAAISATTIGYVLAPRINAAGRMGQIDLAVELFLTQDPKRGTEVARQLCALNRQRQGVEQEIFRQAVEMLPEDRPPEAIVLAGEDWHQGVVGIVASRIAEEYCCPTFLICLDGDHGKASSRSYGGFNLFTSLDALAPMLESYGGHELAAGFTIARDQIGPFREAVCAMARDYYAGGVRTVLECDCVLPPRCLSLEAVEDLERLEPTGCGCPKPIFVLEHLTVERVTPVGGGKHLRLRLLGPGGGMNAIWFSANRESAGIREGDTVDMAFTVSVNEYRGMRDVQVTVQDMRPSCRAQCTPDPGPFCRVAARSAEAADASHCLPDRARLALVWRYLAACPETVTDSPYSLCRRIVGRTNVPLSLSQLLTCLEIFRESGLLELQHLHKTISVHRLPTHGKADLTQAETVRYLMELLK